MWARFHITQIPGQFSIISLKVTPRFLGAIWIPAEVVFSDPIGCNPRNKSIGSLFEEEVGVPGETGEPQFRVAGVAPVHVAILLVAVVGRDLAEFSLVIQ